MTKLPVAARFALIAAIILLIGVGIGITADRKILGHGLDNTEVSTIVASVKETAAQGQVAEVKAAHDKWKTELLAAGLGEYNRKTGVFQLRSQEDIVTEVTIAQTFDNEKTLVTSEDIEPEPAPTATTAKSPAKETKKPSRESDKAVLVPFTSSSSSKASAKTASVR